MKNVKKIQKYLPTIQTYRVLLLLARRARQLYFMKAHTCRDTVTVVLFNRVMKEMHYTINNLVPIHKIQAGVYHFSHIVFKKPLKNTCGKFLNKRNRDKEF
jgi:hypothetical protein